jgi:serine/threonine protein kinase
MSDSSNNWFNKLFNNVSRQKPGAAPQPTPEQSFQTGAIYQKGDFIGQEYEVYGILGKGGFGVVYLVYSHETQLAYALKTFQDEFLADQEIRNRFHKEANIWVELGRHPYLVRADFVDEVSGRLFIAMEYIAPNEEGLNSLEGYLQRQPPDLAQSLRWAIQICHGMEYAYSKGVRAHRDLKPANIMISQDRTARISDFGLAGVLDESAATRTAGSGAQPEKIDLSGRTIPGKGFGTPPYMPPEQFENAAGCDQRSDIYSFGIMLYQMAAGGQLPFPVPMDADWQAIYRLHCKSPVPRLDSPLFPIIQCCLEKLPEKRYQTFQELRAVLEPLLQQQTGETITPPRLKELEAWEWVNKGSSLNVLGYYKEAIRCFNQALELNPRFTTAWNNKGNSLHNLGRNEEASHCFDQALELDPRDAAAWNNKGTSLHNLGRYEEAIRCYDQALELDPHNVAAWYNKGASLDDLIRYEEAVHCYDQALELDPRFVDAWNNKGLSLHNLGRYEEAIHCFDQALELNPHDVNTWYNKALAEDQLSLLKEAAHSYQQFLAFAPASYASQIKYAQKRLRELKGK